MAEHMHEEAANQPARGANNGRQEENHAREEANARRERPRESDGRNIRISSFWKNSVELWFLQLENEFNTHNIRSDNVKYRVLIRHLDEETMQLLEYTLRYPRMYRKYEELKDALLQEFRSLDNSDFNNFKKQVRLLADIDYSIEKPPSVLLHELGEKLGCHMDNRILKKYWLERLSYPMQDMLLTFKTASFEELVTCADKLHNNWTPNFCPGNKPIYQRPQETMLESLSEQVRNLQISLDQTLTMNPFTNAPGPSNIPNNGRCNCWNNGLNNGPNYDLNYDPNNGPNNSLSNNLKLCYYHQKFGQAARMCKPPCSFETQEPN